MLENSELFGSERGVVGDILTSNGVGGVKSGGGAKTSRLTIEGDSKFDNELTEEVSGTRRKISKFNPETSSGIKIDKFLVLLFIKLSISTIVKSFKNISIN